MTKLGDQVSTKRGTKVDMRREIQGALGPRQGLNAPSIEIRRTDMESKAFARYALPLLIAAAIFLGGCASLATPAEVTKACTDKKPGDKVTVGRENVVCQTPTHEIAELCKTRTPGEYVKSGTGQALTCPPPCCYINGCNFPENRKCFDSNF